MSHQVDFTLPERRLGKNDVVFDVRENGARVGRLLISKGAIEWIPRSKKLRRKWSWGRFDALIRELGRKVRKREPAAPRPRRRQRRRRRPSA